MLENDNANSKFDKTEEINEIDLKPKKGEQRIEFIKKEKEKDEEKNKK